MTATNVTGNSIAAATLAASCAEADDRLAANGFMLLPVLRATAPECAIAIRDRGATETSINPVSAQATRLGSASTVA